MARQTQKRKHANTQTESGGQARKSLLALPRVTITVPHTEPLPLVYKARHADVQLDARHAEALRRVHDALVGRARLHNGRPVDTTADVVRWLIEQIADAIGLPERWPPQPAKPAVEETAEPQRHGDTEVTPSSE